VDVTEGEVDEERLVLVGGGEVDGGVHQPLGQLRRYFEFPRPMSVPSLSWLNDRFSDKTAQKGVFSHLVEESEVRRLLHDHGLSLASLPDQGQREGGA
jgi:hypothetical protein